jgi:hypothetical protein
VRLYYFTTQKHGIEAIKNERLKISRIDELNDPFEFMALALGRENRHFWRNWKKTMSERFGLICMSQGWHHPLMWSHYADKHQGLCLCLDVGESVATKVQYRDTRLTLSDIGRNNLSELKDADMEKILHTKFSDWKYESEFRIFCQLEEQDSESGLYFLPFSRSLKLTQVIVGERSTVTRTELKEALGKRAGKVALIKARTGFRKFEVVQNKLSTALS